MDIPMKKLFNDAIIPLRSTKSSAGLDLYALETTIIHPGHMTLVKTGIAMQIPDGYYGQIAMRSGLTNKHGLCTAAGVIDSDYRNDVGVFVHTVTENTYVIMKGERFAQIIILPIHTGNAIIVDKFKENESFNNNHEGNGSTGRF